MRMLLLAVGIRFVAGSAMPKYEDMAEQRFHDPD
jgi:hypothetical protein